MGLIARLLGREPASDRGQTRPVSERYAASAAAAPAPRGQLRFDPDLIHSLENDHRDLVALFGRIGDCARRDDFGPVPAMLLKFKTSLEAHLIAENVRFYNYVENSLAGDTENYALIRSFRREMNQIARGVVDFVKKYQSGNFDAAARAAFMEDYHAVGALLTQRIEREERSLYPLYQPA